MSVEKPEKNKGLVENIELAHEMAKVEAPHQENLKFAREFGLGPEALKKLGIEKDEKVEKTRAFYEKAMDAAEDLITSALLTGERVTSISIDDLGEKGFLDEGRNREELFNKIYDALLYRLYRPAKEGSAGEPLPGVHPALEPKSDYMVSVEKGRIKIERDLNPINRTSGRT